ncbi:MAG TPA: protealysin inhibitor emfourin [Sphingomonas sp.]|jgi:hypothetical protein|uniref:protealysin inhibitor emfourin n=1 Tax=Sphingomonas sp. TaxID=28214 RepID=UPI002EDB82E1
MQAGETGSTGVEGEARIRIEGGLAHFPGLARDTAVSFRDLPHDTACELVRLADDADFFRCDAPAAAQHADRRLYTVCLRIGDREREVRVAEPVGDPALAKLISAVRQAAKTSAG